MPRERIYLDFNATAPVRPAALARMLDVFREPGNASSVHAEGRRARAAVEDARAQLAGFLGTRSDLVTFTSGATEAAALGLTPDLLTGGGQRAVDHLLVGATEHPAVLRGHRFPADRVSVLPVLADGTLDLLQLETALRCLDGRALLALQVANSETGVLQPLAAAADLVHAHGGILLCDAAQGAGRVDCRFEALGADMIVLSGHKLGGPQGVGALVMREAGLRVGSPLVRGGGQESGLRGGTENVAAIAGFGAAVREVVAQASESERLRLLRGALERGLKALAPDLVVFGEAAPRLPNTTAFAVPGVTNETVLIGLDLEGVAVSTGSACSSGKVSRSHVLEAMGVDDHLNEGLIRVSFGWSSATADVDRLIEAFDSVLRRIKTRPARSAA